MKPVATAPAARTPGARWYARSLLWLLASCVAAPSCAKEPKTTDTPPICRNDRGHPIVIALGEIEVEPGETRELSVYATERPGTFEHLPEGTYTCRAEGASIDASGRLSVSPGTTVGTTFVVFATLADGCVVTAKGRVVSRDGLVGTFREVAQVACGSSQESAPPTPIEELRFRGDGSFSVTWVPFEARDDYRGRYTYDDESGSLALSIEGGNYVPPDVDGEGAASFDPQGRLHLNEAWLGNSKGADEPRACEQIFARHD